MLSKKKRSLCAFLVRQNVDMSALCTNIAEAVRDLPTFYLQLYVLSYPDY